MLCNTIQCHAILVVISEFKASGPQYNQFTYKENSSCYALTEFEIFSFSLNTYNAKTTILSV